MSTLYFESEWIIELDKTYENLHRLLNAANELQVGLSFCYQMTSEGYQSMRFILLVPDLETLNKFIPVAANEIGLIGWFHVKETNWPGYVIHPHPTIPMLGTGWKDVMHGYGKANELIRQKLRSHGIYFFASDWVVPSQSPESWLERIKHTFHAAGALGSELRSGRTSRNSEGFFTQSFAIRLYSQTELQKFSTQMQVIEGAGEWFQIWKEDFLTFVPIAQNTTATNEQEIHLFHEILSMSQENARLRRPRD